MHSPIVMEISKSELAQQVSCVGQQLMCVSSLLGFSPGGLGALAGPGLASLLGSGGTGSSSTSRSAASSLKELCANLLG